MATANCNPYLGMNQYRNPGGPQSNFTFTTPTQCTTLGTPRPCIEAISPINLSAPGVGASWQHSIPTTMPWVDMAPAPQNMPLGSATVFTGLPFSLLPSSAAFNNTLRGSKRKALDVPSEAPASKVHLCADQLANMRITPTYHASPDATHPNQQYTINSAHCETGLDFNKSANRSEEWERFRELENRLTVDGEDELDSTISENLPEEGIQVHVADDVLKNLNSNSSPILPRQVMEDVQKPCMQIVLWQAPEKLINNVASKDRKVECESSTETSTATTSNLSSESLSANITSANSTGISSMDTMSPESMYDFQRPSVVVRNPPFQSSELTRHASPACRLSPSPDFLRPLSSSSDSSFSTSSSSSPFFSPTVGNHVNPGAFYPGGDYFNNNNIFSNNNGNNTMSIFDSVDDEMQL